MKPTGHSHLFSVLVILTFLLSLAPPAPAATAQAVEAIKVPPDLTPDFGASCDENGWFWWTDGTATGYWTLNIDDPADSKNSAVWAPALTNSGSYLVEAYFPNPPANPPPDDCFGTVNPTQSTSTAHYVVTTTGGVTETITVDQTQTGEWLTLGTFTFETGNTPRIRLTDWTSETAYSRFVLFSDLRFTYLPVLPEKTYLPIAANSPTQEVIIETAWTEDAGGTARMPFFAGETIRLVASGKNYHSGSTPTFFTWTAHGPCGTTTIFEGIIALSGSTWSVEKSWVAPACPGLYAYTISANYQGFSSSLTAPFAITTSAQFFDKCNADYVSNMQAWWNYSPYYHTNIYIGGTNRACSNTRITADWIADVAAQGWGFVPTWVGPQAPCFTRSVEKFSYTQSVAYEQGRDEADAAVAVANQLGFTGGVPIYYDLEGYRGAGDQTSCRNAVKAFLNGWTTRIHELGYVSGAYGGSYSSYVPDWATIDNPPDEVWLARWSASRAYNPSASPYSDPYVPDDLWQNHRLRQYAGDHNETWGGVTFNIDSNATDGMIAGLPGTLGEIADIQLMDNGQGWVIREDRLMWTPDGGATWKDITPAMEDGTRLLAGTFLDPNTGWLAAESDGLQVLRTSDGGASWTPSILPAPESGGTVRALGFSDRINGWLHIQLPSSSNFSLGVLYRTLDGGETWTEIALPAAGELTFSDPFTGWLAGGPDGSELYRSIDAGATWQPVSLADHEAGDGRVSLPAFSDSQNGMTALTLTSEAGGRVELFTTTDRGTTWTPAGQLPLQNQQDAQTWLAVTGGRRWVAALPEDGELFSSGGRSANAVSAGTLPQGIVELSFRGSSGWALAYQSICSGAKGTAEFTCTIQPVLLATQDGGSTWTEVTP